MNGFYIDLYALNDYLFSDDENRNSSVEITEIQEPNDEGKLETISKTIHEVKEPRDNSGREVVKHDMIKTLFDVVSSVEMENDVLRFSNPLQGIAFNTLINSGILKLNNEKPNNNE